MTHFKKKYVEKHEGKITFGEGIVDNIVTIAVEELPCVKLFYQTPLKEKRKEGAVTVFFDKKGVDVDVVCEVHYSQRVSEIVFRIQEAIRHSVESMTEYKILSVNVNVVGVYFDDLDTNNDQKLEKDDKASLDIKDVKADTDEKETV